MAITKVSNGVGGRIRKVTITEINDNEEWNWPDPGCFEEESEDDEEEEVEMKTTDEIFEDLETVVQDWKRKLEVIVAEGLKTIKKTTKERKMMMKYLPGDSLIGGSNATLKARCQILTDWQSDITSVISATHNKLNKLGSDKIADTSDTVKDLVPEAPPTSPTNTNPCTTVSLDFDTLMRDLDTLYQKYSYINNNMAKVPIYSVGKDLIKPMSNTPFPWWKPITSYAQLVDQPRTVDSGRGEAKPQLLSLLQDFVCDQRSHKSIMEEWRSLETTKRQVENIKREAREKKPARRGRDSVQKMKERKEIRKYKKFLLREIVKKGETHYYVMKKEVEEPQVLEAEDIFGDWSHNLTVIKRPRKLAPRTRKISHRAQRKEMLKQAQAQGPLTYSQMVRKNLRIKTEAGPEVEEMFGPWMKSVEKLYKPSKPTSGPDEVEVFKSWNYIFEERRVSLTPPPLESLECGQPTVKPNKKQSIDKLSAKLLAEGYPLSKAEKVVKASVVEDKKEKKIENNKAVAVRSRTEVVPYVERKPLEMTTVEKITPSAKNFKPSRHSQRNLSPNNAAIGTFIGPINKPVIPQPPPMPSFNWAKLLAPKQENKPAPAKSYKTEEIFDEWRHIFIDVNKTLHSPSPKQKRVVREYKADTFFMEWLGNLEEPVMVKTVRDSGDKENKTPSPKSSKRTEKKMVREQFIDEDVTEIKDNRRSDFAKNNRIKDKKRTENSRKSLNKRVK